jgi:hypothetical protein
MPELAGARRWGRGLEAWGDPGAVGAGGPGVGEGAMWALGGGVRGGYEGGGTCGGEAQRRCHALLHPLGYTWRSAYSSFTE